MNVSDHSVVKIARCASRQRPARPMISVHELTKLYGDFTAVRRHLRRRGGRGPRPRRPERRRQDDDTALPGRHHRAVERHGRRSPGTTSRRDPIAAKRALAFIPDEPHLFEYLSVEEHLRFIARLYGVADVEERIPVAARRARAQREAAVDARRTVARHAAEAGDRVRTAARAVGAHSRRAADRTGSGRHAADARDDRRARGRRRRGDPQLAPAQPRRRAVHEAARAAAGASASRTARSTRSSRRIPS